MLDLSTISKLNTELTDNIKKPDFIEFLIEQEYDKTIDEFYETISIILIEYKNQKREENG